MPNQTDQKNYQFPDGFALEVSLNAGSTWDDIGIVAAGATATLNWDEVRIDAGNFKGLIKKTKNHTCALAPSALWNWDPAKLVKVFDGLLSSSVASTPEAGTDLSFAGTDNSVDLSDVQVRMTHYSNSALTAIDWQFTLYNANIDAGATFNWKGATEDGLDEVTVSFTGRPDPEDGFKLMKLFKAS